MALNYRFLQKRSDVPKRGRLTFDIFLKIAKVKGIKNWLSKKVSIKYKIRQVSRKNSMFLWETFLFYEKPIDFSRKKSYNLGESKRKRCIYERF